MSQRLEEIKARDLTILKGTKFYDDFIWLIKQAEIQQETELTWSLIENEEVKTAPNDFYSIYQDIALKHYGLDY